VRTISTGGIAMGFRSDNNNELLQSVLVNHELGRDDRYDQVALTKPVIIAYGYYIRLYDFNIVANIGSSKGINE
jgi:hypothetical protein